MKKILIILSIALFSNCSPKVNSPNEDLVFRNGKEQISLEILTGNKFIETEIPTKIKVLTENIKIENVNFAAPGLRFLKTEPKLENEATLEITAKKENIVSGKFPLNVSYKSGGKMAFTKFLIPIR